jgi:two-component system sensor histidine kinase RstB
MPEENKAGFDRDISHLESLIDEMLTYARLDHPQLLLQFQPFSPAEWIAQRAEEWQKLNEQKTLTTNTIPADWIWQGDMKLMNRLLDNLVGNGFRYCTQEVRITLSQEHDCAQIIVENDGPPIPPEQAKAIFDPFYRLDPSRDRATGGFGLGLAIVNSIIQAHQGSVHVERGQLGGAAFICRWPLQLTH